MLAEQHNVPFGDAHYDTDNWLARAKGRPSSCSLGTPDADDEPWLSWMSFFHLRAGHHEHA
ncbi:hypothetical protein [Pseudomonas putida]|uniref:hypothetical protein n=1 Tax=Pseudomonas putida TaxID=303 RepID=UPI00300E7224